jgi:hypothetical protein
MEEKRETFVKTDDNSVVNIKSITWIKKMDDCLAVCAKNNVSSVANGNIHKICKTSNIDSYTKLNKYFE